MKRTYQPSKKRCLRQYGFLARTRTRLGRLILRRRRKKGRYRLVPARTRHKFARHTRT
ncbi:50S ribosomal protein L34 [Candidatus Methylacidithermus pantelleriae]|uniref:50S ribosomal protein L34 n=1 Tax=Candidatus Methylacidithermus pantelleriae TaxID=2744239 RepID=UPI00157CD988|nr:50S ribosomal protein L34 [Candidatus Methylacidithermus pantelleriae]